MFLGLSKNIGGGFRVGVGTRIGGKKAKFSKEQLKDKEFLEFLQTAQYDMNIALVTFVEANNKNYKQIVKNNDDLDEVFKDNDDYKEFKKLFESARTMIDKTLYTGESGVVAKRKIASEVFDLKDFLSKKYPNFKPKHKVKKVSSGGVFSKLWTVFKWFIYFIIISTLIGIVYK